MTRVKSEKIIHALKGHYGRQSPPLSYVSLYQLTIAVVLSAQTTDSQVNAVTPALFKKFPDFLHLSRSSKPDVEKIIKSTGFYRNKALHIIGLSRQIIERYGGNLPSTYDDLVTLPGIGRKCASVILLMGFNKPAFPVDTHIFRIGNRLGYAHSKKEIIIEEAFRKFVPEDQWKEVHLVLIKHGRTTCRAKRPLCGICVVRRLCESARHFLGEKPADRSR